MLEALMNPGTMTRDQWMIVGILVFIVIGILYFVYRTYMVIKESATNKYKPNIGLSRIQEETGKKPAPGGAGDAANKDNKANTNGSN